jgi:hypothetical protein
METAAGAEGRDSDEAQRIATETHQQLRELHSQLEQVEEFITSDPTNEQYLQTREDLFNVIAMTEDLIDVQNHDQQLSGLGSGGSGGGAGGGGGRGGGENLQIGDRLEVISGERPYPAVLLSVNLPDSQCTLKYYEYGTEVVLSLHEVRVITGKGELRADEVAPGLRCQCKYPPDQKWYDAKIEAMATEGSYTVIFPQYGSTLEVPLEYIRRMRLSTSRLTKRLSERHMEPAVVIPDNLKINPTDTEAVRCSTSHLSRSDLSVCLCLSLAAKGEEEEEDQGHQEQGQDRGQGAGAVCHSGQLESVPDEGRSPPLAHDTDSPNLSLSLSPSQAEKKSLKLALAPATKKQSLFSSPAAVDGKVGVTGSGQGMTDYEHRKRYKFNIGNT